MAAKRIFKYQMELVDKQFIRLPKDAQVLDVQSQKETPCLWALVEPYNETEERCFEIFGTGHEVKFDMGVDRSYISTFQITGGSFVFHVFERL